MSTWYARDPDNIRRLFQALAPYAPYLRGALEALIENKRAVGRPKDLEAIAELELVARRDAEALIELTSTSR